MITPDSKPRPLTTEELLRGLVKECNRLEPALPADDRVRADIAAIHQGAERYHLGLRVDLKLLDECIRRLRIAATSGKYPDILPY